MSSRMRHRQPAQIIALYPLVIIFLLAVGLMAFEVGRFYGARQDVENLAEAAATAAVSCYHYNSGPDCSTSDRQNAATNVISAQAGNLPNGFCTPSLVPPGVTGLTGHGPSSVDDSGNPLPPASGLIYQNPERATVTVSCNLNLAVLPALLPGMITSLGPSATVEAGSMWYWDLVLVNPNNPGGPTQVTNVHVVPRPVPLGS
jgi:hypothetical protein